MTQSDLAPAHPLPPAPVNDRLYDELLKPIAEDYYKVCRVLAATPCDVDHSIAWMSTRARMDTLAEVGDRTARVLEVAEPLWDDMRAMAGLTW